MKIEAKRVKCGDCIVLTENNEKLIIDCGSDNRQGRYKCSEFAYHQLEKELYDDTSKQLLVTHFDQDHYNGILEIKNPSIFENAYIPKCLVEEGDVLLESFSQIVLLASDDSWGIRHTDGIINLFNKLIEITGNRIISVQKGDTITCLGREMKVLWPEVRELKYVTSSSLYQLEQGREYILNLIARGTTDEKSDFDDLQISLIEEISEALEDMKKSLIRVQEDTNSESVRRLNLAYQKLRNLHMIVNRQMNIVYYAYEHYLYVYHTLIDSMNATSIILEDNENMLFLGDAPARIVSHLKDNKDLKDYYQVIKLQHHATEKYKTSATPSAEHYIISNGGWTSRRISRSFIDGVCGNSSKIICTNGSDNRTFCEYYDVLGACSRKCTSINKVYI